MEYVTHTATEQRILCCQCGVLIPPNPANTCVDCIRNEIDISEGIPKQCVLYFCRMCDRYLLPPSIWTYCELESKELLSLCLKKLRGLSKVRLVDANFVWTEPHSKRVKVKLTIQKEVFAATILQQVFVVEYVVASQICEDCHRVEAKNTWNCVVQVRQKVSHKKTFFHLEQLMLKHKAHKGTLNLKELPDGLDFYYSNLAKGKKMLEFLLSVAPVRYKQSQELISSDTHTKEFQYHHTISIEIAPICKDDLLCFPLKIRNSYGHISPLMLCSRVGTTMHFIDPASLQEIEMNATQYFRQPTTPICSSRDLIEYYIHDVEETNVCNGRWKLAEVQLAKSSDFGKNDTVYFTRTHLGRILNPGDLVLGYDLGTTNVNNEDFDKLNRQNLPDVIIVKKFYPKRNKRAWKLKRLEESTKTFGYEKKRNEQLKADQDYESFLRDLEEDKELRSGVNIIRDESVPLEETGAADMQEEDDEEIPQISIEEMMDEMQLSDQEEEE
eukprot:Lithocolla_globosa_v1_NODE_2066_length_2184_cov_17.276186.p1 type:complete len:498 gc:universal NODE_2066_length_2184_cov_17.276186:1713-220(-)